MSSEPLTAEERLAFVNFVRLWWHGPNGLPVVAAGSQEVADEDFEDMERDLASLGLRLAAAAEEPRPRSDQLDEPTLTRILGEIAQVLGGDLLTGGVKHRVALASAILAALPSPRSDDPEGTLRALFASGNYLQMYDHRQNRWLSPDESVAALHSAPDTVDEPAP